MIAPFVDIDRDGAQKKNLCCWEAAAAFHQELQRLGWTVGTNVQIDYRWGAGDAGAFPRYSEEPRLRQEPAFLAVASWCVGT